MIHIDRAEDCYSTETSAEDAADAAVAVLAAANLNGKVWTKSGVRVYVSAGVGRKVSEYGYVEFGSDGVGSLHLTGRKAGIRDILAAGKVRIAE